MSVETVVSISETREETLARLVREHQGALLRLCCLLLRDEALAREAVQETFLKAYETMDRFRGESTEKTWLTWIALNICRDVRRTNWLRYADRRGADSPENGMALDIAVSRLPGKLREAVLLYYDQGMTLEETAEVLHTAKSTISTRLRQARERLHITLEGGDAHD